MQPSKNMSLGPGKDALLINNFPKLVSFIRNLIINKFHLNNYMLWPERKMRLHVLHVPLLPTSKK